MGAPNPLIAMQSNSIITSGPVPKSPRVKVIMLTDPVGSMALKEKLGAENYRGLRNRHNFFLRQAIAAAPSGAVLADTGN